jgi:plasmid stabilization system protein ParE
VRASGVILTPVSTNKFDTGDDGRKAGFASKTCGEDKKMPRGDKSAYTDKQKRQAEHIEEGYEERGLSEEEAERRAWATVNKSSGGGKLSGSGRGKAENKAPAKKGGKKGGAASAKRPAAARSASAKKAATTRAKKGGAKKGGAKKGGAKKG